MRDVIGQEWSPRWSMLVRQASGLHPRGGWWLSIKCAVIEIYPAGTDRVGICDSVLFAHQLLVFRRSFGAAVAPGLWL